MKMWRRMKTRIPKDILDGEECENPEDGQGFREDDEELFEEAPYQQGEFDGRIDIV